MAEHFPENSDDQNKDDIALWNDLSEGPELVSSFLQQIYVNLCLFTSLHEKTILSLALRQCNNYFNPLVICFRFCEEMQYVKCIELLQEIFKVIICKDRTEFLEELFKEELIFDVVGCLEYKPSALEPMKHRDFLKNSLCYKEVVPIKDAELRERIHLTYRVQFIHDVVLAPKHLPPTATERNILTCLYKFLNVSKGKTVSLISNDKKFLQEVFDLLNDTNTNLEKCRCIMMFLKELLSYSRCLDIMSRLAFLRSFFTRSVFKSLTETMKCNDELLKCLTLEVLFGVVKYLPSTARNFMLQETAFLPRKVSLTSILVKEIMNGCDNLLLVDLLKLLLNPEFIEPAIHMSDKSKFLTRFFKEDILFFIEFIKENSLTVPQFSEFSHARVLEIIIDFLIFCTQHHSGFMKVLFFENDLLKQVLLFMDSSHIFLALSALRLLRSIISFKDDSWNKYIMNGKLFTPVVEAFLKHQGRYNLLYSAILELFKFITEKDMKELCRHIAETHGTVLKEIKNIQTFQKLVLYAEERSG